MRIFLLLCGLVLFHKVGVASVVKVVALGETKKITISVKQPVFGFKNKRFGVEKYSVDSVATIIDSSDSVGVSVFYVYGARFELLLFPQDSITIYVRTANGELKDVTVSGSNAAGHNLWLETDNPYVKKFLAIRERIKSLNNVDSIYTIYTGYVDSLCSTFKHLEQQKSITSEFCMAITSYLKDDLGVFLMEFFDVQWEMNASRRDSLYSRYMLYLDWTNPKYSGLKEDAIDWFYCFKYGKPNLDEPSFLGVYIYQETLPKLHHEFQLATTIAFAATNASDEIDWKRCHKYFIGKFPNSVFLEPLNKTLEPYYAIKDEDVTREVIVLKPAIPYPTLSALFADKYKGKVVFVDFWASWCGPCRSEFIHTKELHVLLAKYNVEMLYISIDEKETAWLNSLKSGILVGSHYRANEQLYADIDKTFFPDSNLGIPRYALIGPSGEILNPNMPRPSSMEKLEEEIKRLINVDDSNK